MRTKEHCPSRSRCRDILALVLQCINDRLISCSTCTFPSIHLSRIVSPTSQRMTFTLKEIIRFLQDDQSMTYSNFSETKRGSPEHAQAVVDKNHEMVQLIRRGASIDEVDYDVKTFVWEVCSRPHE